jgi:hypothetical protein
MVFRVLERVLNFTKENKKIEFLPHQFSLSTMTGNMTEKRAGFKFSKIFYK